MLADKYRTIAKTIPSKLDGQADPVIPKYERPVYWILVGLGFAFPIASGFCAYFLRLTAYV